LELPDLVAAEAEPGEIVALDQHLDAERAREPREMLNRRRSRLQPRARVLVDQGENAHRLQAHTGTRRAQRRRRDAATGVCRRSAEEDQAGRSTAARRLSGRASDAWLTSTVADRQQTGARLQHCPQNQQASGATLLTQSVQVFDRPQEFILDRFAGERSWRAVVVAALQSPA